MTPKISNAVLSLLAAAMIPVGASQASAHAVAIGFTPGAESGTVNLWLGSYHQDNIGDGNNLEGSAELTSTTDSFSVTTPFTAAFATVTPDGLPPLSNTKFEAGYNFSSINSWEVAVVSGLSADTYTFTYVPSDNPTMHWYPEPDLMNISLTLDSTAVSGGGTDVTSTDIPEPTALAILGVGLTAVGAARKRARKFYPAATAAA